MGLWKRFQLVLSHFRFLSNTRVYSHQVRDGHRYHPQYCLRPLLTRRTPLAVFSRGMAVTETVRDEHYSKYDRLSQPA
jgi:hypothetical protein